MVRSQARLSGPLGVRLGVVLAALAAVVGSALSRPSETFGLRNPETETQGLRQHGPGPAACPQPCQAGAVIWKSLHFKASKLLLTATAEVRLTTTNVTLPPSLEGEEPPPAEANAKRGRRGRPDSLYQLDIESKLLGRRSLSQLWFEPATGTAVRKTQRDLGKRQRLKTFRFDADGVRSLRMVPRTSAEGEHGPEAWSDRSNSFDAYPSPPDGPVVEPGALLYLISSLEAQSLQQGVEIVTFADRTLIRVEIKLTGTETIATRYSMSADPGASEVASEVERRPEKRQVEAQVYSLSPQRIDGQPSRFELLGLQGDIEILLDPDLRLPLQVRGRLPPVGQIVVKLESAQLRK